MSHNILIETIKTKVDDQAFIDLLYKYMKVGYGESIKQATPMKVGGYPRWDTVTYFS